jgi:proteic killer suppression protein
MPTRNGLRRLAMDSDARLFATHRVIRNAWYAGLVIASYRDKDTEKVALGIRVKKFEAVARMAQRKLRVLDAATRLEDLDVPPGNRPEVLAGNRKGQHSIRINDQYRICFIWRERNVYQVEIVDYH